MTIDNVYERQASSFCYNIKLLGEGFAHSVTKTKWVVTKTECAMVWLAVFAILPGESGTKNCRLAGNKK